DAKMVKRSNSRWSFPMIGVEKKVDYADKKKEEQDGKKQETQVRPCCDLRELNKEVVLATTPLPVMLDLKQAFPKREIFGSLDIRSAFSQMELDAESQEKCSFVTHEEGIMSYTTLPFGLASAPSEYLYGMNHVMNPIKPQLESSFTYVDDFSVGSDDLDELLDRFQIVFDRFRVTGMAIKPTKLCLGLDKITMLSFEISEDGIKPGPERLEAIINIKEPHSVKSLRQYLGAINFFRIFIPNCAAKTYCMTERLKQKVKWDWPPECHEAY